MLWRFDGFATPLVYWVLFPVLMVSGGVVDGHSSVRVKSTADMSCPLLRHPTSRHLPPLLWCPPLHASFMHLVVPKCLEAKHTQFKASNGDTVQCSAHERGPKHNVSGYR